MDFVRCSRISILVGVGLCLIIYYLSWSSLQGYSYYKDHFMRESASYKQTSFFTNMYDFCSLYLCLVAEAWKNDINVRKCASLTLWITCFIVMSNLIAISTVATYKLLHEEIDAQSSDTNDHVIKVREKEISMSERLSRIRQKCVGYMQLPYWQNLQIRGTIWTYVPRQLHYCVIPKVGCTFWKRILRFLAHDVPPKENIQHPSDIDRMFVHYGALSNIRQTRAKSPTIRKLMTNGTSFMFTRDPYSRLWSAYIDKFLLPDFWRYAPIIRIKPNATEYELKCGSNVTFHNFLLFIHQTANGGLNEHWGPMHTLCNPCHVQYDFIGKLESFGPDANYILAKHNLEYLVENTSKLEWEREEIKTLTKYNFNLEPHIKQGCFDKLDIAKRLWLAFQYNGYIHRDKQFPEKELLKTEFLKKPIYPFLRLVFQTIEARIKSGIGHKSQKRTMMKEAYRKIPNDLLEDITKVYEYDFELFRYERNVFK